MKDGLFKSKYRVGTIRLEGFDYGANGAYFVTMCSHHRRQLFSRIQNGETHLFPIGILIREEWERTHVIREYVTASNLVVMPDHIHGILFIHKGSDEPYHLPPYGSYLHFPEGYHNRFGPQRKNLASIIRGSKSAVTQRVKLAGLGAPVWQPNYYEHIIRNERELERIALYIANNPLAWEQKQQSRENQSFGEAA